MSAADGVALAVLLAFALWGAVRGPLRQLLSLSLIALAFLVAPRLLPHAEPLVAKVGGLGPEENAALAWGLCVFLVLVAGGLLLAALSRLTGKVGAGGPGGRALGAALGAVKGAALLLLVGYALLAWPASEGAATISLRRDAGTAEATGSWRDTARRSHAANWLVRGGGAVREGLILPAWIDRLMRDVDAEVRESR
ncbi:MAG: CvpA family protein [Planctomycetota bacterium]|nr:CvpA family protein [Planctomycetota bacterium]